MKELIEKWKAEAERNRLKITNLVPQCKYDECATHSCYYAQLQMCIADAEMKLKQDTTQIDFARWIVKNSWSVKETAFFIQAELKPKNHGIFTVRYYRYLNDVEEVKTIEELYSMFICE